MMIVNDDGRALKNGRLPNAEDRAACRRRRGLQQNKMNDAADIQMAVAKV